MDYEVCRKVWESQVPVQFTLHSDSPLGDPLPYYTMLPRYSYLSLALPKVLSSFNRRDDGEKVLAEKVWLESNGNPLKMYIPIGVIYDQMHLMEDHSILEINVRTLSPDKPNTKGAFQMVDRDTMEAMFMQTVKEADYLKTKAEVIKNMQKEESAPLWRSVVNNNFDEFWTIIQKLMDPKEVQELAHIPLRVYVKNQPFKQILLTSKHEDGSLRTIGEAVSEVLKDYQQTTPGSSSDKELRLISHGIDIPLHTPLIFAAKNLSYPDNFLHIVIASN